MCARIIALVTICGLTNSVIAQHQQSNVALLAVGRLSGDSRDLSGLTGTLETDTPVDQLGGFSAIDYSGIGNRYFVLSDRGPGDGAASFPCRLHEFDLQIDFKTMSIRPKLCKTILLKNSAGQQLTGSLPAVDSSASPPQSVAFDCEGMRVLDPKSLVLSDEYGPSVRLFGMDGNQEHAWTLPTEFKLCPQPNEPAAIGAFTNRGLEGLARSVDGTKLVAAMQGPLLQDGAVEGEKCLGLNTRWLVFDRQNKHAAASKQLVYQLTDESTGVSEILAVDADRYLVIERDSKMGAEAVIKHIYLADTRGATDASAVAKLNRSDLPSGIRAISKTLLIDLRDEKFGLGGDATAEKPEGICWGPELPDGRRLLIVCVDNDFEADRQSEFYAFAIALKD